MPIELQKPYIGVTGVSTPEEAIHIGTAFTNNLPSSHQGMVGVLVSDYTLDGCREYSAKYPDLTVIPEIFTRTKDSALNVIHFRTRNRTALSRDITRMFDYRHMYDQNVCQAVQLNMRWPNPTDLAEIKKVMPDL